jgi:hypothetical protein
LFAWLALFGSITMNSSSSNSSCLEAADDVYTTIIDVLSTFINPSNTHPNITGLFSKRHHDTSSSSSSAAASCVMTMERLLEARVHFLILAQKLKLGLGIIVITITTTITNSLSYYHYQDQGQG